MLKVTRTKYSSISAKPISYGEFGIGLQIPLQGKQHDLVSQRIGEYKTCGVSICPRGSWSSGCCILPGKGVCGF